MPPIQIPTMLAAGESLYAIAPAVGLTMGEVTLLMDSAPIMLECMRMEVELRLGYPVPDDA